MKKNSFEALKNPELKRFILARLFITLASQMQAIIVGWQVYELTKDPFSLGLIGLAEAIPSILVALYAGHITDIIERKKILLSAFILMFVCSLSLLIVSTQIHSSSISYQLIIIYSIVFFSGIARGFASPSSFAFLSQLTPKELLPNVITWNTFSWQFGAVLGPTFGGLCYGFIGVKFSYLLIILFTSLAIFLIANINSRPIPIFESTDQTLFEKLTVGVRFVFKNKIILSAMSLDLFAVLFGGAVALLPIFAGEILNVGSEGLGILRAAPSIGAVIMAIILAKKSPLRKAGRNLLIGVAGFGFSIIIFALSKNFYLSIFALVLSGMFDSISVVIRTTIFQLMTPEHMKGRVSAVNSIFIGSSNEIGAFESGLAAKLLGVIPSVIAGGSMTIIITALTSLFSKELRKLKL